MAQLAATMLVGFVEMCHGCCVVLSEDRYCTLISAKCGRPLDIMRGIDCALLTDIFYQRYFEALAEVKHIVAPCTFGIKENKREHWAMECIVVSARFWRPPSGGSPSFTAGSDKGCATKKKDVPKPDEVVLSVGKWRQK